MKAKNQKDFSIILGPTKDGEVVIRKNNDKIDFPEVLSLSKTNVFNLTSALKPYKGNNDAIYLKKQK